MSTKIVQLIMLLACYSLISKSLAEPFKILNQLSEQPTKLTQGPYKGHYYVPSTLTTIQWGYLPNRDHPPVLSVASGSVVTFDTVSHEGLLEDQGRNASKYFSSKGVAPTQILAEAKLISQSTLKHDFEQDGPHIVTGPVEVLGAQPGDVLKVEVIAIEPRVPYGVISNRHGKGTLVGEFPKLPAGHSPDINKPSSYGNVSVFTPIQKLTNGQYEGRIATPSGKSIRFPLKPFMGIMGVAANTSESVNSIAPAYYGGNLDINALTKGSTVYFPVQVSGALFYTGDGHFSQGNGEVALTALEGSTRATFKLTVLKAGVDPIPSQEIKQTLAETSDYWITPGLDTDLDEAMKNSTREAIRFLNQHYGIDEELAYAYLSAATDFNVSQVVDKTKGIHALIPKQDLREFEPIPKKAIQK